MTPLAIILCILCQFLLVGGQLVLKHAMNAVGKGPWLSLRVGGVLSLGIFLLSLWFFLWLGLLHENELSLIYPFEGLNPALMVIGAAIFLKERISSSGWIGILLISAGVALVSTS